MIRGIISLLKADAGVTTLVSASKIYPVVAEQAVERPYVTVRRAGVLPTVAKNQASNKDVTTVNIAVYTKEYKEALDIMYACRAVLDDYGSGRTDITPINDVVFLKIYYVSSQDLYDKDDLSFVVVDSYNVRHQIVGSV